MLFFQLFYNDFVNIDFFKKERFKMHFGSNLIRFDFPKGSPRRPQDESKTDPKSSPKSNRKNDRKMDGPGLHGTH